MHVGSELPPLPLNKSCIEVFADFLTYLFQCASRFIKDAHANGGNVWSSVQKDIHFVLSHPNGWEGFQQSQMRKAAILAGLISDSPNEHARITFVTEGEASLHFAIQNGLSAQDIKVRTVMLRRMGLLLTDSFAERRWRHYRRCWRRHYRCEYLRQERQQRGL